MRIVALDTHVPGVPYGALCPARLAWLDARLAERPDTPTIVAMHHPPFTTGLVSMDAMRLNEGEAAMASLVARNPQIERILCGHVHRPIQARWHGTLVMTAPATAHQLALELERDTPPRYTMEPPAILLHSWRANAGLVTHQSYIGDFGGALSFPWAEAGAEPASAARRDGDA